MSEIVGTRHAVSVEARPATGPAPRGRGVDLVFLLPVLTLLAIGVGMVFSASFVVAHNVYGNETYFFVRHLAWVGIGLVIMFAVAHIPYSVWRTIAWPLFAVALVLLALVLMPGVGSSTYGASRWLNLGSVLSFQPSEVAKLAVVVYLASWITRVGGDIGKLAFGTIPFAIILCVTAGLILKEPDVGTTAILAATAVGMFFIAGANLFHALVGGLLGSVFLLRAITTTAYQTDRLTTWLDPWADPEGLGWQTTQTLLALGSGGLAGLGLGAGRQKYFYIPNAHTDTIYAIVGEEIGFLGTTLVLVLFLLIAWRGLSVAAATRDPLGRALAAGCTLLVAGQGLLNMAVVSHLVPATGVPLPLMSYGGSSMVITLTAVGIVLSVGRSLGPEARPWRSWLAAAGPDQDTPAARPPRPSGSRRRRSFR